MNRPFVYRGVQRPGVFQRCAAACPAGGCARHNWAFSIELPVGPNKQRRQITKSGYPTGKDAMEAREDVRKNYRDGRISGDLSKDVKTWLTECLNDRARRGELEDSTLLVYRLHAGYLIGKVGHLKLAKLTGLDLSRVYTELVEERDAEIKRVKKLNARLAEEAERENARRKAAGQRRRVRAVRHPVPRPLSPATIARLNAMVSGCLRIAVKVGLISRNVAADAQLPKVKRKKVKPVSLEQYGTFLDRLETDYRLLVEYVAADEPELPDLATRRRMVRGRMFPLVVVAGFSGLRRGELAGLRWSDIDLDTGKIVVAVQRVSVGYQVSQREPKTEAGEDRIVFLDVDALALVKEWNLVQSAELAALGLPTENPDRNVFTRPDGAPYHPEYVTREVKKLATEAGLSETKLHGLRHFRAATLISSGADISAVSKTMGHSSISVTSDIYGSLFDRAGKELADRAAHLVPRANRRAKTDS